MSAEYKYKKLIVRFKNDEELSAIASQLKRKINKHTIELHYPEYKVSGRVKQTSYNQPDWKKYWVGMPEFIQEEVIAYATIVIYVREDKIDEFKQTTALQFNSDLETVNSIWYEKEDSLIFKSNLCILGGTKNGKYPIYIISKGRWEFSHTSKHLTAMQVPHNIVVEPQEYDNYQATVGRSQYTTILKLDMTFKDIFDSCDPEGDSKGVGKGSGPARNFCWEHSISQGFKWHWLMDDNIDGFHRLNKNHKIKVRSGAIFKAVEDFVERFDNIAISGLNYSKFAIQASKLPPYVFNTRIFSCIFIRNDLPIRWRSRYNEDVDLNIRAMKLGYATCQFNSFLADKMTTQTVKGGNTDEFYKSEGTLIKSKVLENLHPDITTVVWKFSRWHHHVDYSVFKNNKVSSDKNIIKKYDSLPLVDNQGMYIIELSDEEIAEKYTTRDTLEAKYKLEDQLYDYESEYYAKDVSRIAYENRLEIMNNLF